MNVLGNAGVVTISAAKRAVAEKRSAMQFATRNSASFILSFLLLHFCTRLGLSQTMGDAMCINGSYHPGYAEGQVPLMDSANHIRLISPEDNSGVWQRLDLDENRTAGQSTEWAQEGLTCHSRLITCWNSDTDGPQNNWLITQYINRSVTIGREQVVLQTVRVLFTVKQRTPCDQELSCTQAFSLYVWEAAEPDAATAADTTNYRFIATIPADLTPLAIQFHTEDAGFYLGIRDTGTCVELHRTLVYYDLCPAMTLGLVSASVGAAGSVGIRGQCASNSSPVSDSATLNCSLDKVWRITSGCECNPGYQLLSGSNKECVECPVRTFSDSVSNSACQSCPANSEATQPGLTECPCLQTYYRAPDERAGEPCTQPPSSPLNLTVSELSNTSLALSWLPPHFNGGRDTEEISYTLTYRVPPSSEQVTVLSNTTSDSELLTDLTPFVSYELFVTADNKVSFDVPDVRGGSAGIRITTLEGVAARVTDLELIYQNTLDWSPPNPPHGIILYYNIRVTTQDGVRVIEHHNDTIITTAFWSKYWNVTEGVFKVQVQAVTKVGAGQFSNEVPVNVVVRDDSSKTISTQLVLYITVPGTVLLILIIVILVVVILVVIINGRNSNPKSRHRESHESKAASIEDYANVKVVQGRQLIDGGSGLTVPDIPISPCPRSKNPSAGMFGNQEGRLNNAPGPTYACLEGPGHHVNPDEERMYTPDPTLGYLQASNPLNLLASESELRDNIDNSDVHRRYHHRNEDLTGGRNGRRMGGGGGGTNAGNAPHQYWELEGPAKPSYAAQLEQRKEPSKAVFSTDDTYWNEGLGPTGSKFCNTSHDKSIPATSKHIQLQSEPFYMELKDPNYKLETTCNYRL